MIIDRHGHYTTAPKALEAWRNQQITGIKDPSATPEVADLDDELRDPLRLMKERGADLTIFSPRASFHGPSYRRFRHLIDLGRDPRVEAFS